MDFWDATKVLFRRWYVTFPLLLLTIAGTAYTATQLKADYVLTSYVQLIPPQTAGDRIENPRIPKNPWNDLGLEALSQAANYATTDKTFLDRLEAGGYSKNITITSGDPIAGATFEVIGKSREQAVQTTELVIKRYRESAQKLQAPYKLRSQDVITVQRLDQGENLERPGGKVKRAIIAVFGVGMLLTCAITIAVDALMRRRRQRREAAKAAAAEAVVAGGATLAAGTAPAQPGEAIARAGFTARGGFTARAGSAAAAGSTAATDSTAAAAATAAAGEPTSAPEPARAAAPEPANGPRIYNGARTAAANDHENETVVIRPPARDHENETVVIRVPAGNGQRPAPKPRTDPAPLAEPPTDATIVLPLARGSVDDRKGKRR